MINLVSRPKWIQLPSTPAYNEEFCEYIHEWVINGDTRRCWNCNKLEKILEE